MTPDALRARWRTRGANAPLHAEMVFKGDALFLGAGTVLAKGASASGGGGADHVELGAHDCTRAAASIVAPMRISSQLNRV